MKLRSAPRSTQIEWTVGVGALTKSNHLRNFRLIRDGNGPNEIVVGNRVVQDCPVLRDAKIRRWGSYRKPRLPGTPLEAAESHVSEKPLFGK
jgi:hypothetical protein